MLHINNNSFSLDTDNDWQSLDYMADMYNEMEATAKENAIAERSNLDDPEYGLVVNKPIYTQGVNGSNQYLALLKTENGEELTWKRLGSTGAEGVIGIIDIYASTLPSGEPYKTLYINMYGTSNSKSIPKGFIKQEFLDYFAKRE